MKKFLIGVIFIIPIVVVVALSVTGTIIGITTPVNPSEMVIKSSDNVEIGRSDYVKVDVQNFEEFIIIDVLPAITQDKEITYERVEGVGEGEVELEKMGESNRYSIIPKKIGTCKLDIRAKANVNVYKEITFHVTSDSIESIEIYDENGIFVEQNEELLSGGKYFVDINPIDALRNNDVQWSSSNTSVVEISENGELKIVGKGLSRIKASAVDKNGATISDYFDVDTSNALVSSNTIYTSMSEITTDYLKENHALSSEVLVSSIAENRYSFALNGESVEVEVVSVDEDEIGFIELLDVMYTRNGGYYPIVGVLATGTPLKDVKIEVSNTEVLEFEPITGMLVPLKAGQSLVSATIDGITIEKEVAVRENPIAFELELGSADQKLGIQLTRTWGRYWLDENGNRINTFKFGLTDKNNTFDVEWSASDSEMLKISKIEGSQDVILEFTEASKGQSVTLTATLKVNNLLQQRVKRSFTFNLREKDAINVYTWDQLQRVGVLNHNDIVLQADLYPTYMASARSSIYGNGFKIDATDYAVMDESDLRNWRNWLIDAVAYGRNLNGTLVIEDVVAVGSKAYEGTTSALGFVNTNWCTSPIEVKYCQMSGFNEGLSLRNVSNALVEGCIFGENYLNGVSIQHEPGRADRCTYTFKNNIFKQQGGSAIQLVTSKFREPTMDKLINVDVVFEGFMDVYNWKQREEFKDIFAEGMLGLVGNNIVTGTLRDHLAKALAEVVESFIMEEEYDGMFYKYGGEEYASFAYMGLGVLSVLDQEGIRLNSETPLHTFVIPLEDEKGKPKGKLETISSLLGMVINFSKPPHISNPCVLTCTDFINYEPEIKPGDPIPNSKELYEKLVGTISN